MSVSCHFNFAVVKKYSFLLRSSSQFKPLLSGKELAPVRSVRLFDANEFADLYIDLECFIKSSVVNWWINEHACLWLTGTNKRVDGSVCTTEGTGRFLPGFVELAPWYGCSWRAPAAATARQQRSANSGDPKSGTSPSLETDFFLMFFCSSVKPVWISSLIGSVAG